MTPERSCTRSLLARNDGEDKQETAVGSETAVGQVSTGISRFATAANHHCCASSRDSWRNNCLRASLASIFSSSKNKNFTLIHYRKISMTIRRRKIPATDCIFIFIRSSFVLSTVITISNETSARNEQIKLNEGSSVRCSFYNYLDRIVDEILIVPYCKILWKTYKPDDGLIFQNNSDCIRISQWAPMLSLFIVQHDAHRCKCVYMPV